MSRILKKKLFLEDLNEMQFNTEEFEQGEIQTASKTIQTGIIMVTKENQKEVSEFFNLNLSNKYPEFNLGKKEGSLDIGTVDNANYSSDYCDEDQPELLKIGIGIMIQKKVKKQEKDYTGPIEYEWDIYPNPNPYNNENESKNYTTLSDINESKDTSEKIPSLATNILFDNPNIDSMVEMAYKLTPTKMIHLGVIMAKNEIVIRSGEVVEIVSAKKKQDTNAYGYIAVDIDNEGAILFSHAINSEPNGMPIGYGNLLDTDCVVPLTQKRMRGFTKEVAKGILASYSEPAGAAQSQFYTPRH